MACFEVIVKDVNSNEKEVTTNKILLSLYLINVKDGNNFYVGVSKNVIVCPCLFLAIQLYWELQTPVFLFFPKIGGAANLRFGKLI